MVEASADGTFTELEVAGVRGGMFAFIVGIITMVAGVTLIIAGIVTWNEVSSQLEAESVTVAADASCQAGEPVDGPVTAWCQAEVINTHALEATGGLTYAELGRDDPLRAVAASASFLRASLFTSVVAYGVAAMAMGVGLIFMLIGAVLVVRR